MKTMLKDKVRVVPGIILAVLIAAAMAVYLTR
jgi:hypothetical protein